MSIKPGVDLTGILPEMGIAVSIVMDVARSLAIPFVITSGRDGKHSPTSLHYSGLALDFRANHVPEPTAVEYGRVVAERLGKQYDVILERDKDGKIDHLHCEFDAK